MSPSKSSFTLTPERLKQVDNSYLKFYTNPEFYDTFYETLLDQSMEIRKLLEDADDEKMKTILRDGLTFLISFAKDRKFAREKLERIGKKLSRENRNVSFYLYPLWVKAFTEAAQQFDDAFDEELEDAWRMTLVKGIDLILSFY